MSSKFQPVHPSRRGDFTAKAKRAGMSVSEYADHVLADSNADTHTKEQAAFVRARKKWRNA